MGTPGCLLGRYPLFNQRWELRDQFAEILELMDRIELQVRSMNDEAARILVREMEEFRVWSWHEVDRDEFFYKIREFHNKAHHILQHCK